MLFLARGIFLKFWILEWPLVAFLSVVMILNASILMPHFQFNFSGMMEPSVSCFPGFFMAFFLLQITILTQGRDILSFLLMNFVLGQFYTRLKGNLLSCLQYSYLPFTLVISSHHNMFTSRI